VVFVRKSPGRSGSTKVQFAVGREASAVLAGVLAREETGFVAAVNLD